MKTINFIRLVIASPLIILSLFIGVVAYSIAGKSFRTMIVDYFDRNRK